MVVRGAKAASQAVRACSVRSARSQEVVALRMIAVSSSSAYEDQNLSEPRLKVAFEESMKGHLGMLSAPGLRNAYSKAPLTTEVELRLGGPLFLAGHSARGFWQVGQFMLR